MFCVYISGRTSFSWALTVIKVRLTSEFGFSVDMPILFHHEEILIIAYANYFDFLQ